MRLARLRCYAAAGLTAGTCAFGAAPQNSRALNPLKASCAVAGAVSPTVKKACTAARIGIGLFSAIKGLVSGPSSGVAATASGSSTASNTELGLAAIGTWVLGGAVFALHETAKALSHSTAPQLESTWFSSTYWRVAGIAAVLTLPFLFAAAVQALIRSDLALLLRAVLGYLPLAMLAVAIAAPLAMLLLSASDQLSSAVSSAAGDASTRFLHVTGLTIAALTFLSRSPFIVFFVGLLTVAGALTLWIELLLREAAVYIVVLMLPLVFAAMVWPARRTWAVRAVELLVALILSKFAIVAVLSLGGAAISKSQGFSVSALLAGVVLLGMGVFAPWTLLRLIPLAELAGSASASLRHDGSVLRAKYREARGKADLAEEQWTDAIAVMRRDSERGLPADNGAAVGRQEAGAPTDGAKAAQPEDIPVPDPREPDLAEQEQADESQLPADPAGNGRAYTPSQPPAERISGMSPMWQQDDLAWSPVLDPDGVRGAPVWPPRTQREHRDTSPDHAGGPDRAAPVADDHDLTPPPQPPSEGLL